MTTKKYLRVASIERVGRSASSGSRAGADGSGSSAV